METEQQNQSQSKPNDQTSSVEPKGQAESYSPSPSSTAPNTPPPAPARPRRPQRTPQVEGSIDVSEPKPPESPKLNQLTSHADLVDSNKPNHPSEARPQLSVGNVGQGPPSLAGQKISGHAAVARSHIAVRTASLPQALSYKQPPSDPVLHPQRALSVAGTADTQAQVMEDFRIHIITWNVGSAMPPDDITSLLGLNIGDGNTDMYIIGLQEVNSMINKRLKDVLFTDQWSEVCMDALSLFGYVLVTSQRMQGMLLLVFAKYYHLPFLRAIQTQTTRTGLGGIWGNKGGVSVRMTVFGHSICFLNCHLPAHMENSEQRMEDFESILQQQQFEGQAAMGVLDHDVVFWFGDLNFRIADLDMQVVKGAIENNKFSILWEKDQLNMAKDSETVLEGFHEGPLKFPPTYKFDVGTDTYDTSGKKRKPAWTDRILWRLRPMAQVTNSTSKRSSLSGLTSGTRVSQHFYRSHMEYTVSDHKPVSSMFTLQFPYKVDIPLVTIFVEDEWTEISDAVATFKVAPNFSRSSWDWIGLYKVGFKHHKDYVGYIWAKQEESDFLRQEHQVTFAEEELPKDSGDFILGYYSNNMGSIVGVTEPFQIQLPASTAVDLSASDSSDFTSEDEVKQADSGASSPVVEERQSRDWSAKPSKGQPSNPNEPHSKDNLPHSSSCKQSGDTLELSQTSDDPVASDESFNSGKDATKPEP
ncbi:inositol polyphosphate 5-phosphatase K-like [Myxocyprinus asiaticus]|uniref:inositol polyphosphate 5-phosphatase K-like n=1 Tax=Myxocyprinus asiaticus TaxID=70543 RepID=UPI002223C3A0|nr:inositol polyphosphate 5-phosphatase K-like [Myxocyprinus asiaticus]XP_051518666.1 inositol polyphosphate 5-phosphatase K-like [Myxocyprinus asiaticus]